LACSCCSLIIPLLILVVGSFDEFAIDKGGAGADEGNQVGAR
jgi:hypothetical protein